jgi:probable phosphoglycerate mutase
MLRGLRQAVQFGIKKLEVRGDSKLLVNQVNGTWKVNNKGLVSLVNECRDLGRNFDVCRFDHVYRESNKEADAAANRAMDTRSDGEEFIQTQ